MGIQIDGSANTISGLAVGGLPDGSISSDEIASNAVTVGKLASTLDLSSNTVTLPNTSITAGMLASTLDISGKTVTLPNTSVTAGMLASTLDLSSKTVTLPSGTGGKILQVVTTDYTGLFSTSTANTWTNVSGLDRSITLASNTSRVLVIVSLGQVSSANDVGSAWDIRRDTTAILQGATEGSRIACSFKVGCYQPSHATAKTFTGIDSPGASGTYTYKIWCRSQGGTTLYLNRTNNNEDSSDSYAARPASHLTLVEIA